MILELKKMQAGRNTPRRTLDCKVLRSTLHGTNGTLPRAANRHPYQWRDFRGQFVEYQ